MAGLNDIRVHLDSELSGALSMLKATRITFCMARECRFNERDAQCILKNVDILKGGGCSGYEPKATVKGNEDD